MHASQFKRLYQDAYIGEDGHRSLFSQPLGVEIEPTPQMSDAGGHDLCSYLSFQEPSCISIHLFVIPSINLAYGSLLNGLKL